MTTKQKRINMFRLLVLTLLTAQLTLTFAATDSDKLINGKSKNQNNEAEVGNKNNGTIISEQYGGLVTDQTITAFGHTFYQHFVSLWRDQPLNDRYIISIHERTTARFGTQVWVEYEQRRMFQAFLPPSDFSIRLASEKAVAIVTENIMNADVERLLFRDADFAPDEI